MPWLRTAYTVLAAIALLLVVVQFLTAGLGIFGASDFDVHEGVAGVLHLVPLLMLIAALAGRLGRFEAVAALALLILVAIQSSLPGARDDAPEIAALHPLTALIIFYIAHMVFQRSRVATEARTAG
jgi:hypothetical protein